MAIVHVPGRKSRTVMLYALSTCAWCQKTKKLLDELGVEYDYEYVDQLHGEERRAKVSEMSAFNPASSFPTLVIDNELSVVGFKEDEIREALEK
jgi:glutaredoxin-like protein NrdH